MTEAAIRVTRELVRDRRASCLLWRLPARVMAIASLLAAIESAGSDAAAPVEPAGG